MKTEVSGGIHIESIAPFEDAMKPLNKGYYICGGIGLVAGLAGGITGSVLLCLLGMFLWWVIKANIALAKWRNLRAYEFYLEKQIPYKELVGKLTMVPTSYGFRVNRRTDGSPEVSYKNVRIQIVYNENGTFSMPWTQNARIFLFDSRYITSYKNTVSAMSILGYHVQQTSSENAAQEIQNENQEELKTVTKICGKCGATLSEGAKFCRVCGAGVSAGP